MTLSRHSEMCPAGVRCKQLPQTPPSSSRRCWRCRQADHEGVGRASCRALLLCRAFEVEPPGLSNLNALLRTSTRKWAPLMSGPAPTRWSTTPRCGVSRPACSMGSDCCLHGIGLLSRLIQCSQRVHVACYIPGPWRGVYILTWILGLGDYDPQGLTPQQLAGKGHSSCKHDLDLCPRGSNCPIIQGVGSPKTLRVWFLEPKSQIPATWTLWVFVPVTAARSR